MSDDELVIALLCSLFLAALAWLVFRPVQVKGQGHTHKRKDSGSL